MQRRVLVGTEEGLYAIGARRQTLIAGHEVTGLARESEGWWALVDARMVWRGGNGDWKQVARVDGERATCLFASKGGVLLGTAGAHLLRLNKRMLRRIAGFEKVQGRQDWYTPWGGPPDTRSISEDPAGTTYVNVHVGGIARSTNGGRSWAPTIDIDTDVHQVLAAASHPGCVLAASARGLAISTDRATSWALRASGLHAPYLRAVASSKDIVLVSASSGPSGQRAAVYRAALKGEKPFERCRTGLPEWFSSNIDTFCLVASGRTAAFGTSDGRLFVSADEGQSWELRASDLPAVRCVALA